MLGKITELTPFRIKFLLRLSSVGATTISSSIAFYLGLFGLALIGIPFIILSTLIATIVEHYSEKYVIERYLTSRKELKNFSMVEGIAA